MRRVGQAISAIGGLLIIAPIVVAIAAVAGAAGPEIVLDRAPTFILGGLACFVIGIAVQEFG